MIEKSTSSDEFYIGWMPNAPTGFAKHVRRVVVVVFFLAIVTGILLSLLQIKFSTAVFEFGQLTEIKGIYNRFPVPSLKVKTHKDVFGNSTYITMPLVGYGKSGAEGLISKLELDNHISLDKKQVIFRGSLLYSDGKTLLQIDGNDQPLVSVADASDGSLASSVTELGTKQLTGEILDPKCYLGVMKPGQGKPHRDCAIRCIAGGISPVFKTGNERGGSNYYLILDENGNKMNRDLTDYVAEPISLTARVVQYDDWIILYTDKNSIRRTGGLSWRKADEEKLPADQNNPQVSFTYALPYIFIKGSRMDLAPSLQ
jgi:hypothetical protein